MLPGLQQHPTNGTPATMASDEAVSLREYFERLLSEHDRHHERDQQATLRPLDEARREIERRLEGLNELREEYTKDRTEDRGQYVRQELFNTKMDGIAADFRTVQDGLSASRAEQASQRGRQTAYAIVLAVALVLVPLLVQFIVTRGGP